MLTIRNPFGSKELKEGSVIEFGIGGVTNAMTTRDVGDFEIRTFEVDDRKNERYLVD